jgi:hypothetical protein
MQKKGVVRFTQVPGRRLEVRGAGQWVDHIPETAGLGEVGLVQGTPRFSVREALARGIRYAPWVGQKRKLAGALVMPGRKDGWMSRNGGRVRIVAIEPTPRDYSVPRARTVFRDAIMPTNFGRGERCLCR